MKYIVTGGAGFIRSHLVDCQPEYGHAVVAFDMCKVLDGAAARKIGCEYIGVGGEGDWKPSNLPVRESIGIAACTPKPSPWRSGGALCSVPCMPPIVQ